MDDFRTGLAQRTRAFALAILSLCKNLHNGYESEHIGHQLLRCATSAAANFRAACHAKSSADFYAKLKICEEKAILAKFWLDFIVDGNLFPAEHIHELRAEAEHIARIFASSCRTLAEKKMEDRP